MKVLKNESMMFFSSSVMLRATLVAAIIISFLPTVPTFGQFFEPEPSFTRQDSLRGSITPERVWWDVNYYDLNVDVDLEDSTFSGFNDIFFTVLTSGQRMQIDLQEPMKLRSAEWQSSPLPMQREGNVYFITFPTKLEKGTRHRVHVEFEGKPRVARNAPWDGGVVWTKDRWGRPFVATANQGIGASVWWPNKDHGYDEPDSMAIRISTPDTLMNVSNGRLLKSEPLPNQRIRWHWFVSNPINNYGVNINIGTYTHFNETFSGEKGELTLDYYVLKGNETRAKAHFVDVPKTLEAFEYWFGPYPFYEDGYKLVQAPYLGMEHQSSVTYGNGFQKGYLGRDLSQTGWGMLFDFIIVHESGHEWFANNITAADVADLWIHESFTDYSESLFLEYHYGKEAAFEYVRGLRQSILNDRPMQGIYDVHYEGSSDMYFKGANMLHTLRQWVQSDSTWREVMRGMNETFRHQTVRSHQVESFIADKTGLELAPFFNQYLRDRRVPVLELAVFDQQLRYRWSQVVEGFQMPVQLIADSTVHILSPETNWSILMGDFSQVHTFYVDPNVYASSFVIIDRRGKE